VLAKVTVNGQQVTVKPTDELGRTYDVQTYTFPSSEPDSQAPSVPGNLTATGVARGQVNLSWSASTDNVGVTGYRVYRNGTLRTTLTGSATTFSDTTVTANTTYSYTVSAIDGAGNESAKQARRRRPPRRDRRTRRPRRRRAGSPGPRRPAAR